VTFHLLELSWSPKTGHSVKLVSLSGGRGQEQYSPFKALQKLCLILSAIFRLPLRCAPSNTTAEHTLQASNEIRRPERPGRASRPIRPKSRPTKSSAGLLKDKLENGPPEIRQAYAKLIMTEVSVTKEEIGIIGSKAMLAKGATVGLEKTPPPVLTFVRGWRTRRDSNARPLPSEGIWLAPPKSARSRQCPPISL
jgi:hypothetical protein